MSLGTRSPRSDPHAGRARARSAEWFPSGEHTGTTFNHSKGIHAMNLIKSLVLGLSLSLASLAAFAAQINLNTASAAELETLNGVGAAKAEAIVAYRSEHGGFKSVDELANVKGIGDKTVSKNRDQMTVAAPARKPQP